MVKDIDRKASFKRTIGRHTAEKALDLLRDEGARAVVREIQPDIRRMIGQRPIPGFRAIRPFVEGRKGMEVGGPSRIFSDGALLPIYPLARAIDNFNIASCAVEDEQEDHTTVPDPGSLMLVNKVIEDGAVLDEVPDATYEFAASSHALEHFANPIKALVEWKRTLGSGGALLLCVPHKDGTFDHRRPTTEFSHIVEDFRSDMGQDDMTHMREAIDMADLSKAPWITREEYVEKCSRNPEFRYIHHHAFVTETVVRMVDHGGFRIVRVFTHRPHQIVLLAEKTVEPEEHVHQLNARFIEAGASWRRRSPFPSDRR